MVEDEKDVFMTTQITNVDIYNIIKKQGKTLDETLDQAKKTNGRVLNLEVKSLGLWVSNHPFKFALTFMAFTVIVISDLRHPLIEFITKLFI